MINDGVKIVSLTEQISLMVKESIEDFIIETIEPYCSELAEIKISKEELKKVILKNYPKTDVLDKIRAEIVDTGAYEQEVNGETEFLKGINYCLGVIDKCVAESEVEE